MAIIIRWKNMHIKPANYNNVKVINNKYVYDKKNLYYKNSFVKYENGKYVDYNPTAYDFDYNYQVLHLDHMLDIDCSYYNH